jgi:hypothetical protein
LPQCWDRKKALSAPMITRTTRSTRIKCRDGAGCLPAGLSSSIKEVSRAFGPAIRATLLWNGTILRPESNRDRLTGRRQQRAVL